MGKLKKYANVAAYEADVDNLPTPYVCLAEEEHKVFYQEFVETMVVAKFNVTDTANPTVIAYRTSSFSEIEIDGVAQPSVVSSYTFSTTGEHTVKYTLTDSTTIGDAAFDSCSRLTSVTIPNSVTSIGDNAFFDCTGLTAVHISDIAAWCNISFGTDDSNPLYNAQHLYKHGSEITDLVIPNSVTSIGNSAFTGCTNLTSVTIPNSVTSIGAGAFTGCTNLTSVTIPNSVTSIGWDAFGDTAWYNNLPDGLIYIGKVAYRYKGDMPENTSINIAVGTVSIANNAFTGCSSLTSITIPNSVTSIGDGAFSDCSSLTSITIGNSVTSIGNLAFLECRGLTSITSLAMTAPTISSSTFQNIKIGGTLTVPSGSTGYDTWMGTGNYYLGKYGWTKVEQ